MKDGVYDFHFSALSRDHAGALSIRGNIAEGGDPIHAVTGQISRAGNNLIATFDVVRRVLAGCTGPSGVPAGYTLKMFGTGNETQFNVIGLAPLGLIVEFHGTWRSELSIESGSSESNDMAFAKTSILNT